MSYWSHNPELLDEIILKEFRCRADNAPGECIICGSWTEDGILDFYWIEKKFGLEFASDVAIEAERNYWDGLCP